MERTFTVQCTMESRWIPAFIHMLDKMQRNGQIGHSEFVGLYSDGDGNYRPKFVLSATAESYRKDGCLTITNPSGQAVMYDAG